RLIARRPGWRLDPPVPGGSMTSILIVEDDDDTREALKDVLANEGFDVRATPGAREAIEEVTRPDAPGLVLLDATMPGMSGADLLDWMRKRKQLDKIPVVLVSADATCAWHERAGALAQALRPGDAAAGRAPVLRPREGAGAKIVIRQLRAIIAR